ncbi:MAG: PEP-CTERM sorting domain-containing protein [Betaproteobacteria bacterium]|nr:MAG: PEP-CTERM sorting domain-containing protein [Betaproteobacteria bacterium]
MFQTFSPQRLFTALGSDIVDVNFFVPGLPTPAFTSAFGAVFTDVDLASVTSLQFFNLGNRSLGTFFAPVTAGESIGRVRITSGNTALGPNETGGIDLVVMDDFIYAEPHAAAAIPEPPTALLLALAFVAMTGLRRIQLSR